jgi:hypothetical protein
VTLALRAALALGVVSLGSHYMLMTMSVHKMGPYVAHVGLIYGVEQSAVIHERLEQAGNR